ncbi:hypothetical protein F5887DRAFT_1030530 [Amanita rubescens]|nr:hypothetical protein F5887DRAFT_1030530 [Amanita rubescens]
MDLSLDLTLPEGQLNINMDDPHYLITRLRSLTIYGDELDVWLANLQPLIEILHQTSNLQVLNLEIRKFQIDTLEELTMPSLRDFCLTVSEDVEGGTDLNVILHSFTCPSLIKLELHVYGSWAAGSFEIIKRQYNIQRLEELELDNFPLSISSILRNAPMLRTLSVRGDAILDDPAIIGISSGTLGRFLTNLDFRRIDCDTNEVLRMVETRMKTVNALIENSRSWREDITIIKDVSIYIRHGGKDEKRESEEAIAKLKEAGIDIKL